MKILFITSFAVIVPSPEKSRPLFLDTLGPPLEPHPGDDYRLGLRPRLLQPDVQARRRLVTGHVSAIGPEAHRWRVIRRPKSKSSATTVPCREAPATVITGKNEGLND